MFSRPVDLRQRLLATSIELEDDDCESTAQVARLELPEPPTVLIVEDDPLVMARLRALVADAGYPVETAASGAEALVALESSCAAIVVTDLNMPGMDGMQLCRSIRQQSRLGYIYIVLLTVRDKEQDILGGLDAGADDYLSKQTSPAHFTARLGIARRVLALEYSLKMALETKHKLAMTDALTGVYNRRYFMRHLDREVKRSVSSGAPLSLLILDVDHFKSVNDSYGHSAGDIVLQMLAQTIGHCLKRNTDWCARLGGEEFAVVLEGTDLSAAHDFAEKVRQAILRATCNTPSGHISVTVSIGVSDLGSVESDGLATVQSLLEQADGNLYASKAAGRNCVTSARTHTRHLSERPDAKIKVHSLR